MLKRECGSCQECCVTMMVVEINKPAKTPCPHLCSKGCGIYETRPWSCQGFQCLWLCDLIDDDETEALKPSNSGLMFTVSPSEGEFLKNIWEVKEGAFAKFADYLKHIAKSEVFILRHYDGSPFSLIGKPQMIREFVKKHIDKS